MNTFVFLVTLIVLCLEDVTSLICRPSFTRHEPSVQELHPPAKELRKYYCEGDLAEIDCESKTKPYHQWYQGYPNSTNWKSSNGSNNLAIGEIPYQNGTLISYYSITVEKFDNNTSMYCKNEINSKNYVKKLDIQLCDNSTNKNRTLEQKIHRYSENKSILFSCEEYDKYNTVVGVINTIFNIIITMAQPVLTPGPYNKTDNGTYILCCIYYEVKVTDEVTKITRRVANKTLLIYDDNVQQDTLESTGMPSTNAETSGRTITLYIVSVVGGTLLLAVAIVICKKRCHKKLIPDNKIIFYADLDVLRNVQSERRFSKSEEETPYAEIIGVMKPNQ